MGLATGRGDTALIPWDFLGSLHPVLEPHPGNQKGEHLSTGSHSPWVHGEFTHMEFLGISGLDICEWQ